MDLRAYARAYDLVTREDTTEEALSRAGVPAALVDRVFENIARGRP